MPSRSEVRTFNALESGLSSYPFRISIGARAIDILRSVSERQLAVRGPALGDLMIPLLREQAGPLRPDHPWLEPGDWDYAMKSHFDFVVECRPGQRHPLHPVFAVEFDGPTHDQPKQQVRDRRKNRLAHASGLPLLRVREVDLAKRDRTSMVEWLAELWAIRQVRLPKLVEERDAQLEEMGKEAVQSFGSYLLVENPELDVELILSFENPFPPIEAKAARLSKHRRFHWPSIGATFEGQARWTVDSWSPPAIQFGGSNETETWTAMVNVREVTGNTKTVSASVEIASSYPLYASEPEDMEACIENGQFPHLFAGPWLGATNRVGTSLCWLKLLSEIDSALAP